MIVLFYIPEYWNMIYFTYGRINGTYGTKCMLYGTKYISYMGSNKLDYKIE